MLRFAFIAVAACGPSHHHGEAAHPNDTHRLYVEIAAEGRHDDPLHDGALAGLSKIGFASPIDRGGDVELQVEVSNLEVMGTETMCSVKVLVLRLPQHDLLGIADGNARARGTSDQVADDCIAQLASNLVRGRVRTLLRKRLDAKR